MKTDFETLKLLASFTINHLKEDQMIDFKIDDRASLIDALATELGVSFSTDEDIRDQALEEVEEKLGSDAMTEDITESEVYNHARKEIIKSFNGENIGGLYLVESLHQVAVRVNQFLSDSDLIEDIFGTDDEVVGFVVSKIRTFSTKRL
ncbi:MAG: hypothetical protein CME61_03890 [Halobacteriovoraceae bacterium]|nr:hypothetical protein [Halobacteriovoraceae bacterium]